jgi:hypothetical protein
LQIEGRLVPVLFTQPKKKEGKLLPEAVNLQFVPYSSEHKRLV